MSVKYQRPTVTQESDFTDGETRFNHPAYAVMRISNPQGGNVHLFGSDIPHDSRISLQICPANWKRSLYSDWIYGDSTPIVEVEMTHAQFVAAIQSSGSFTGTPVTLRTAPRSRNRDVERVPYIEPLESSHDMIKSEIEQSVKKAIEKISLISSELTKAIDEKKGIKVLRDLARSLDINVGNLPANMGFSVDMAQEAIDKKKHDAQIEIEAMLELKVRKIGMEAIGEKIAETPLPELLGFNGDKNND